MKSIDAKTDRWEFYPDQADETRWRHATENNRLVGAATEGYKNRQDAIENARFNGYPLVRITEEKIEQGGITGYQYHYDFSTNNGWPRKSFVELTDFQLTEPIQWLLGSPGIELVEIKRAA